MRLCLLQWLVIYRLLILLSLTCEVGGAYVRSEASIEPSGGVGSQRGLPLHRHASVHDVGRVSETAHHLEHLNALWDGIDLPTEIYAGLGAANKVLQSRSASKVQWGLLGPFDTGTNLFAASVHSNFPQVGGGSGVWKHSTSGSNAITKAWQQHIAPLPLQSMVLVMMVRSPLSLISSWKKAPYNLYPCINNKQYTDMNQTCQAKTDSTNDQQSGDSHSFAGVADIYNTYLRQYRQLQIDNKFKQVMLVTYEDLVSNPKAVMMKFAHAMDIVVDGELDAVTDSAKGHGHSIGRAAALAKLKSRPWLSEMGPAGRRAICPHLSNQLIHYVKEGSGFYDQDCRNYLQ